ncbi:hypothetical protein AVEN_251839-1 [Araneus ventricosus]|uniref:Uncharacterized protein n=1 Tax=Araneus ventricosus TaxID=182803 RepID=A0A4Y2FV07_ARAVE|nr:hypothetical protein AVEN_251839-1 [Araneus ventricosus]
MFISCHLLRRHCPSHATGSLHFDSRFDHILGFIADLNKQRTFRLAGLFRKYALTHSHRRIRFLDVANLLNDADNGNGKTYDWRLHILSKCVLDVCFGHFSNKETFGMFTLNGEMSSFKIEQLF